MIFSLSLTCGCSAPNPAVDRLWPPLVVIWGRAVWPLDFTIVLAARPAPPSLKVRLLPLGTTGEEALALGRVVDTTGYFSLSVPLPDLPAKPRTYEVQALLPSMRPLYTALLALDNSLRRSECNIDSDSTVLTLAARRAQSLGRSTANWHYGDLVTLPAVKIAAQELDAAILSLAVTGEPALDSAVATLQNSPDFLAGLAAVQEAANLSAGI
ncbi:MAG: hypothetical protein HY692_00160 [Cyanobacteria bacterium NC_groundwater_1444_Ag_S-0.65um_54_12]|nr:hypothetical protein [Cyanobacteria bacterium NC_groundwater_1444_Ag_S-0.65um_54_12]